MNSYLLDLTRSTVITLMLPQEHIVITIKREKNPGNPIDLMKPIGYHFF